MRISLFGKLKFWASKPQAYLSSDLDRIKLTFTTIPVVVTISLRSHMLVFATRNKSSYLYLEQVLRRDLAA